MTRGRKPTPTEVHDRRGTFNPTRHGRDRHHEVKATGAMGPAPDWLTARQKEIYYEAANAAPKGLLKRADQSVFIAWVTAFHSLELCTISMGDGLPLVSAGRDRSERLSVVRHPLDVVRAAARRDLIKAASELGFSPAARARIPEPPESLDDDEGEQFFRSLN